MVNAKQPVFRMSPHFGSTLLIDPSVSIYRNNMVTVN